MVWQGNYSKLYIGGRWVSPATDETIDVVSPFTEQAVARVPAASRADVDQAVAAAREAFEHGPWPRMQLQERLEVLRRLSVALGDRHEQTATLVSQEMGCPISLSRTMQTTGARLLLDSFLDLAPQYPWSTVRRSNTGNALVTREPVGVVAAVVPWNAPLLVTMLKLAPALLTGCTVILKPSPEAPLNSYLFAEMLQDAGLPGGVVNIVPAHRDVSEYLVTHRDVDKVSFTGSTAAGRRIASLCGQDLRRVTLELGGKSAAVILDDADLDVAVESIRALSLRNNGQACSNKTRIVVSRTRHAELLDRLTAMVGSMPVGDPADPATQVGPVVSAPQRERVEGYIDLGRKEGAKVLVGGGRPAGLEHGWFVEPTVFTDVQPSMRIAQEEIFGPVLAVLAFDDEEQAVAIANDSDYGLNGSVFTSDPEHALAVARRIRTGTVELNGHGVGFHAPIGGFKCSGIGREAGLEGFDSYVELKSYGLPAALADALS
ncbi:aldehyde dehydrogenase [Streptomyces viridiviolaceus]|uniref:aldehyde dehydrogenase (NAD(+)) n=1 Tax=Streptomyces viridiviolaceus TaxID=68282 RepID=A0ABW2ECG3_9ACTN|nr:aldehyde dehydrogenase [Streptomyces viridiviolaceus]GHB73992.1 aldehyde dehydrogenase [Streptomyces viridiviolaceus]